MLREDVVEAVAQGRFHIYAVSRVEQALELLTGQPAGERDAAGNWPPDSLHGRIDARLTALARALDTFGGPATAGHDGASTPARRAGVARPTP
jgi:hypothetical protein